VREAVNANIDDAVLVKQSQQGDSSAIERLILKYQNRIYNVILKICGNTDDAAELTQDTFVKVIEKIEQFEGRSGFYTWVFRIAVNLTLNYRERSVKLGLKSLDGEDNGHNQQAIGLLKEFLSDDGLPNPAVVAANKELYKIVLRALMRLEDSQRTVIILRDIEGMNYAQIAKVCGLELGTVKSKLSRARSRLREILEAFSQ
jgi:RNA polymerase sigma-70 factor (ECF subfamily)